MGKSKKTSRKKPKQSVKKKSAEEVKGERSKASRRNSTEEEAITDERRNGSADNVSKTRSTERKSSRGKPRAKEKNNQQEKSPKESKSRQVRQGSKSKAVRTSLKVKSKPKSKPKSKETLKNKSPSRRMSSFKAGQVKTKSKIKTKLATTQPPAPVTNVFVFTDPKAAQAQEMIQKLLANLNLQMPQQPQTDEPLVVAAKESGAKVIAMKDNVKDKAKDNAKDNVKDNVKDIPVKSMAPVASSSSAGGPYVSDQAQLEELYDAGFELHTKVKTVHESYQEIIRSLVNLQRRRPKQAQQQGAGTSKHSLLPSATSEVNTPTKTLARSNNNKTTSTSGESAGKDGSSGGQQTQSSGNRLPRSLECFMNADTRDQAFDQLFGDVEVLRTAMAQFEACFDTAGYIDMAKYDRSGRVTVADRDAWMAEIASLDSITGAVLAEYNKEVLDMFRISQSDDKSD